MAFIRTWAPSIVMSILVGTVFFLLRGFGPESTLQRFHVAAANRDFKALQELSSPNSSPQALQAIQNQVLNFAERGYRYEVRSLQQQKGFVVAVVNYTAPNGRGVYPMLFVLEKRGSQWYVDPGASLNIMSQVSNGPGTRF